MDQNNNKLFVGGISWDTNDESLKAFFSKVGEVVDAIIVKDKRTGKSKGFGFVTMSSEEEATKALETLNNQELDGRTLRVARALPPKQREQRA